MVDRWHVGFCDLSGGQGLLGQVEGRTAQAVSGDLVAELEGELKGLPKKIGVPILAAWNAKEDLRDLLALPVDDYIQHGRPT